jgi:hypothetical protein
MGVDFVLGTLLALNTYDSHIALRLYQDHIQYSKYKKTKKEHAMSGIWNLYMTKMNGHVKSLSVFCARHAICPKVIYCTGCL